jgi:hypothetical protein
MVKVNRTYCGKMTKEKGRQWDGKSRISNDTYRKRWDEIFKKEKSVSELLQEGFEEEQNGSTEETNQSTD